ncbi:response regulator [Kitasatospora sp. NPDC004615]|uniref:response regulator n=1 Tax=Kitasatospora sp. NPDC004615 TaxID=3364017 RepID=UPI0036B6F66F
MSGGGRATGDPAHRPIRVLVVEDDLVAADAHARYVARTPGFTVTATAHSRAEAVRALDRAREADAPVDLILLDLYLPDGHGLHLCAALRAAGHTADIIAVTSARDLATVRQAVTAGVVQYLLKPFGAAALGDRLGQYARYRASLGRDGEALGQDEVDRALALLRGTDRTSLPKGLTAATLETVAAALRTAPDGLSAGAAAEVTGVSRITARRYLEHLVTTGHATREPRYGQVGRPELGYRWKSE